MLALALAAVTAASGPVRADFTRERPFSVDGDDDWEPSIAVTTKAT
ncbi:MAG TPA: hypothetical protein VHK89_03035 [Actinomycetota bacterium]|nr:hypothetical protein [Actinomycetota bacterium]